MGWVNFGLSAQVHHPFCIDLSEEGVSKILDEVYRFARRLHLRPERLIDVRELIEREHGDFDGIPIQARLELEVLQLVAEHHLGGPVDVGLAVGLGDSARCGWLLLRVLHRRSLVGALHVPTGR